MTLVTPVIFLFLCAFLASVPQTKGLKCYSCTGTYEDGIEDEPYTCVNNPTAVPGKYYITCPERMKYCTIVRHDYKGSGMVSSIQRNCAERPDILNDDVEGGDLLSHYRSCLTDLCNKGTGVESSDEGSGGSGGGGMIVPGRSPASIMVFSPILVILLTFSLCSYAIIPNFN